MVTQIAWLRNRQLLPKGKTEPRHLKMIGSVYRRQNKGYSTLSSVYCVSYMNKNSFEMVYWFHSMIFLTNFRKRQFLNMTELLTPTIGISHWSQQTWILWIETVPFDAVPHSKCIFLRIFKVFYTFYPAYSVSNYILWKTLMLMAALPNDLDLLFEYHLWNDKKNVSSTYGHHFHVVYNYQMVFRTVAFKSQFCKWHFA